MSKRPRPSDFDGPFPAKRIKLTPQQSSRANYFQKRRASQSDAKKIGNKKKMQKE